LASCSKASKAPAQRFVDRALVLRIGARDRVQRQSRVERGSEVLELQRRPFVRSDREHARECGQRERSWQGDGVVRVRIEWLGQTGHRIETGNSVARLPTDSRCAKARIEKAAD
jgi:hypothetical protein